MMGGMMNDRRRLDGLVKQHYLMSRSLEGEYEAAYEDITAFLRSSTLVAEEVEVCVGDVLDMLIEGQERGVPVSEVVGKDMGVFCRQIVQAVGKAAPKDRAIDMLRILIPSTQVSLFFAWVNSLDFKKGIFEGLVSLNITMATVINLVMMVVSSLVILRLFHVILFPKKKQTPLAENIRFAGLFLFLVMVMVTIQQLFDDMHLFDMHAGWIVFAIGALWIIDRLTFGPIPSDRIL